MIGGTRTAGWAIGVTLLVLGMVLHALTGHGYGLLIGGVVVIASVLLERRYRGRVPAEQNPGDRWSPTGERFIDSESGEPMQVWADPLTGERRYQPVTVAVTKHP